MNQSFRIVSGGWCEVPPMRCGFEPIPHYARLSFIVFSKGRSPGLVKIEFRA